MICQPAQFWMRARRLCNQIEPVGCGELRNRVQRHGRGEDRPPPPAHQKRKDGERRAHQHHVEQQDVAAAGQIAHRHRHHQALTPPVDRTEPGQVPEPGHPGRDRSKRQRELADVKCGKPFGQARIGESQTAGLDPPMVHQPQDEPREQDEHAHPVDVREHVVGMAIFAPSAKWAVIMLQIARPRVTSIARSRFIGPDSRTGSPPPRVRRAIESQSSHLPHWELWSQVGHRCDATTRGLPGIARETPRRSSVLRCTGRRSPACRCR